MAASAIASVFPRGTASGLPGLIELDLQKMQVRSEIVVDSSYFLSSPLTGQPTAIRQTRGLTFAGGFLYLALFNSILELHAERLDGHLHLRPMRRFQHPSACDLHGVAVSGDHVAAASTGSDALLVWSRRSGSIERVVALGGETAVQQMLNFPEDRPEFRPDTSWRKAVMDTLHVNDVAFGPGGSMYATSLTRIWKVPSRGEAVLLHHDDGATFHDGLVMQGGLLVTDAARGQLVVVNAHARKVVDRVQAVDPDRWFLRGVLRRQRTYVVAVSERVPNRQLVLNLPGEPVTIPERATFGLLSVHRHDMLPSPVTSLNLRAFPRGAVVYALGLIPSVFPKSASSADVA